MGGMRNVYQYTELPNQFRVQVIHVLMDVFGDPNESYSHTQEWFKVIHDVLAREYGVFRLSDHVDSYHQSDYRSAVFQFLGTTTNVEQALDVIELSFRYGRLAYRENPHGFRVSQSKLTPDDGIDELNQRFREHGIGFQFESDGLVRMDSQILHQEAVRPALQLLTEKRFAGANSEFLKAHEHYRHGRYAEAVNECLKAFESTLKVICQAQRWQFEETDTAKTLLDVAFAKNLIPPYMQSQFGGLRSILESGVPTTRSRTSAHGSGAVPKVVPPHLAGYVLHLTASSIVFLAEAEKQLT